MDVKLVVVGGKSAGREIAVPAPKFLIGRSEDCHLRPGSDLVSRHHCAILIDEGLAVVRDFGSRNGTFVNDQRVHGEHELKTGDHLRIGPLVFEVQLSVSVSGKKKPKVTSIGEAAARTVQSAKRSDEDDLDIGDLLGEDDQEPASAEQQTVELPKSPTEDTKRIDKPQTGLTKPGEKTKVISLPAGKKGASDNSQNVAADALRKYLRNR